MTNSDRNMWSWKLYKLARAFPAILLFLCALTPSPILLAKTETDAYVRIQSNTGYLDSFGYYHIVGEIRNVGSQPISNVRVDATYHDSSNVSFETRFDVAMLDNIPVGRKSPFDVVLMDIAESARVDHYSLTTAFSISVSKQEGLEILEHYSFLDAARVMHIVGEIKNIGSEKVRDVKIVITGYDSKGDVVAAVFTFLDPEHSTVIDPSQTASFDIMLIDERFEYIQDHRLTVESPQYICKEENPQFARADLDHDGIVSLMDVKIAAVAFGSRTGDLRWNSSADLDGNGKIDMKDVAFVARNLDQTT